MNTTDKLEQLRGAECPQCRDLGCVGDGVKL